MDFVWMGIPAVADNQVKITFFENITQRIGPHLGFRRKWMAIIRQKYSVISRHGRVDSRRSSILANVISRNTPTDIGMGKTSNPLRQKEF